MTACVLCSAGQEYTVCTVCSTQIAKLIPALQMRPDHVADLPSIRTAGIMLKGQISQGHA